MTEAGDETELSIDAGRSLGSGLDEIGWEPRDQRLLLKPRPLRPSLRRQSLTPAAARKE